jgi:zinc transporter ZupT
MEARVLPDEEPRGHTGGSLRTVLLGVLPLALIIAVVALFALLGAPGLRERAALPVEDLVVERTVLRPGQIELTIRNDGPDPVSVAQVIVNEAYVDFTSTAAEIRRLGAATITIAYPWIEGQAYRVEMLTSLGAVIGHEIGAAAATPVAGPGFYGLLAVIGTYVGVIPVMLGMLWLPWLRRLRQKWMPAIMALTVGLLLVLGVDAALEGIEIGGAGPQSFGGAALVVIGAVVAFVAVAALDATLRAAGPARDTVETGLRLALLVAIGIGLHNLGEGLAIGAAYSAGALALGALLVIGFAIHNTTEGLAIVAPVAAQRPSLARLVALGLIAGAPAIPGAWLGATAVSPAMVSLLLGVGVGAIAQVIAQLAPYMRDARGRYLHARSAAGLVAGIALLYVTSLLVSI